MHSFLGTVYMQQMWDLFVYFIYLFATSSFKMRFNFLQIQLDAGMWRYHANRMDAHRSQFDLGRVDAYI